MKLSQGARDAFAAFNEDKLYLALPLMILDNELHPLSPVRPTGANSTFQNRLNELDSVLDIRTPLYLLLRRNKSLTIITFAPYLAKAEDREKYLIGRHELARLLGEEHFSTSLICKEIGELTDARSWAEREENAKAERGKAQGNNECEDCHDHQHATSGPQDVGHVKNKCRLCDRRMKNKISPEALEALKTLDNPGATVQIVLCPLHVPDAIY